MEISIPIFDDDIAEDSEQYFVGVLVFEGDYPGAILGRSVVLLGIFDNNGIIYIILYIYIYILIIIYLSLSQKSI